MLGTLDMLVIVQHITRVSSAGISYLVTRTREYFVLAPLERRVYSILVVG